MIQQHLRNHVFLYLPKSVSGELKLDALLRLWWGPTECVVCGGWWGVCGGLGGGVGVCVHSFIQLYDQNTK